MTVFGDGGRQAFLWRHLSPALVIGALLLAMEFTAVDSAVSAWFFDRAAGVFALRYDAVVELVGHQWAKQLAVILSGCVVAMWLMSFQLPELEPQRRLLLFLSLALILAPLAVILLKEASVRHCPWNLAEFGGFAPHLSLFDGTPPGVAAGHCFPGGHASAGFSLFVFYFAGHALRNRALALCGLWGGLASGMALGMVRVAQGAHFISHNLWSGLVCWLVILAVYMSLTTRAANTPAQAGP
jgi:membrane-associated PAP2 superfamily phosphatase